MSASAADGKTNWDTLCAKCHGEDGKGQTKMGQKLGVKDFTDAKVQADLKDDAAAKTIKEGKKDADGKTMMKAFDTLSDEEIKGLVAYVRRFEEVVWIWRTGAACRSAMLSTATLGLCRSQKPTPATLCADSKCRHRSSVWSC